MAKTKNIRELLRARVPNDGFRMASIDPDSAPGFGAKYWKQKVLNLRKCRIGVIGLGYVGLPLAVEFGKHFDTTGFDVKAHRIAELSTISYQDVKTLAFYSHVEAHVRVQAVQAGFDLVIPRSRMAREGASLVTRLVEGGS